MNVWLPNKEVRTHRFSSLKAGGLEHHPEGSIAHYSLCGVVESLPVGAAAGDCADDVAAHIGIPLDHPPLKYLYDVIEVMSATVRHQQAFVMFRENYAAYLH